MQWLRRHQNAVRLTSLVIVVVAVILLMRQLPTDIAIDRLREGLGELGPWAYVVAVVAYVLGSLFLVPGGLLTLSVAAAFGFWRGVPIAISSATLAAAVGFVIARRLGRTWVEQRVAGSRWMTAIDAAVAEGGWKVILLLRLSPVVPFSIANYLYGLTPVKLWRYVVASFFGMIPGGVMYVYLGSTGVAAASGNTGSVLQTLLLAVGAIATVALCVYVSWLARRKLKASDATSAATDTATDAVTQSDTETGDPMQIRPTTFVLPAAALFSMVGLACASPIGRAITGLFGPPTVAMTETYADAEDTADFDHSAFDALLKAHVDDDGFVDYDALKQDRAKLDDYLKQLADAPFDELGRDEKLALLINAYNAFMLDLVLRDWPIDNITDDLDNPFDSKNWTLAGEKVSLNMVEHEKIRPNFKEPRIHWAVVCGAFSCPKLRNEAYTGDNLEAQLADQTKYVFSHPRYIKFEGNRLELTKILDWYGDDFKQSAGSVLEYVARQRDDVKQAMADGNDLKVSYIDYQWLVNDRKNRGKLQQ